MDDRCVNCNLRLRHQRRYTLENNDIRTIVSQWIDNLVLPTDFLCHICWTNATEANPAPPLRSVCTCCGRSLYRTRSHHLRRGEQINERIYLQIERMIAPRNIRSVIEVCHSCWVRANNFEEVAGRNPDPVPEPAPQIQPQENPTIHLPDYFRATQWEGRCFVGNCQGEERHRITTLMRKMLLREHNFYVPANSRLCTHHHQMHDWDFINHIDGRNHYFNALQIQDMLHLKEEASVDWNNDFANMTDEMLHWWTGRTRAQFNSILAEVPNLAAGNGPKALLAYLIKLRTGDSYRRLAALFKQSERTLRRFVSKARAHMKNTFVPQNLGLNNITREEIIRRTLLIPSELFGTEDGVHYPVVICDGTYSHVQKSSNFSYQKKTFSLHKHRNLIKPFLMVCSDGYILDVFGPYAATASDAQIMRKLFTNAEQRLQEYFHDGDIFILDRGFRDALPLLRQHGYKVFVPATRLRGENQLTTLQANQSRAVTLCRWVVEVVNGRFKRDFKIFRQDGFNLAAKSMMTDFRVASALLNRFHPVIRNRPEAVQIVRKVHTRMHQENILGQVVVQRNINLHRNEFRSITVAHDNIVDFPDLTLNDLIMLALGTYQIKIARSYYGEHIRPRGRYIIEICLGPDNLFEGVANDQAFIIRGRIRSRHIARKKYYIYLAVQPDLIALDAIKHHYCSCIVGKRTVGCCAHIMCIVWYLGWARYQNIIPPASFLDDVLEDVEV